MDARLRRRLSIAFAVPIIALAGVAASSAVTADSVPSLYFNYAFKGKAVKSLTAGRYHVTVTDKSKKAGFTLQERNHAGTTVTSAAGTTTHTVTITMSAGQWFFYGSLIGTKTYFLVASV